MRDFADTLKMLRATKGKGESQDTMAKKIGISLSTYSRIERGEVEADLPTLIKLTQIYKMGIDELVHYGDPAFTKDESQNASRKDHTSTIPVTVALDGTDETLNIWIRKLTAINKSI